MKALEILKQIRGDADFNEDFELMQDCEEALIEIEELQATIEAQEIIIKDKTAIMEVMAHRIKYLELPKNNGISSLDIRNINASKMMGIIK